MTPRSLVLAAAATTSARRVGSGSDSARARKARPSCFPTRTGSACGSVLAASRGNSRSPSGFPCARARTAARSAGLSSLRISASNSAADARSSLSSSSSGSWRPEKGRPSPGRIANSAATASACRRRIANANASAEARSSQCASSTRSRSGRSSAAAASRERVAAPIAKGVVACSSDNPRAARSASRLPRLKPLEFSEDRSADLQQRRERQLSLRLHAAGAENAKPRCARSSVLQQRRLTDPRLTHQHKRAAHPLTRSVEQRTDTSLLVPARD